MFWRHLILSLLLGAPSCRIFTLASVEYPTGQDGSTYLSEEELIDTIVKQLTEEKNLNDPLDKKDSTSTGINLDSKPPAAPSSQETGRGAGTGADDTKSETGSQQQEQQQGDGTKVVHSPPGNAEALQAHPGQSRADRENHLFPEDDKTFLIAIGVVFSVGFVGLLAAGVCYYKYRRSAKAASDVEYPAYGVTGPMKDRIPSPGDRKLAQSAQMYHYQHQKQQMIAMEKANGDMKHDASDDDSEEDNVEGDYTVYECPGLAPTGEMEVKNPLFRGGDAPVSASPPQGQQNIDGHGEQEDQPPPYRRESQ